MNFGEVSMSHEVKVYRITGKMKFKTGFVQEFKIEVPALNEEHALEKLYSILGSRHKLKRSYIRIDEIRKLDPEEVESQYVKEIIALDKIVKY